MDNRDNAGPGDRDRFGRLSRGATPQDIEKLLNSDPYEAPAPCALTRTLPDGRIAVVGGPDGGWFLQGKNGWADLSKPVGPVAG